jgi:hypothetical protein
MNHFLSRLGRSAFGRHCMPFLSCVTVAGYLGIHTISHDLIRKLFVAQGPDGRPVQISDYLRDMITDVFLEVDKAGFHVDIMKVANFKVSPPTIRWFASSTVDPIVYGMTDFKTGVSIGVPNSYNYHDPDDLPDYVFEVRKLAIIRSPQGRELEQQRESDEEIMLERREKGPTMLVRRIDRKSQEGREYIDSLLLSENAKKFSLARELYVGDSYRPLLQTVTILLSSAASIISSRAHVQFFKLKDCHITQRLPGYAISGLFGYGLYLFLSNAVDDFVAKTANTRAKSLGDNYISGAEEYFRKQATRDRILGVESRKYT